MLSRITIIILLLTSVNIYAQELKFEDYVLLCPNTHWFGEGGKSTTENLLLQCLINNQFGRKPEFFDDVWNLGDHNLIEKGYRYYWPNDINIEYSMKDIDDNNSNILKAIISKVGFPKYNDLEEITIKGLFLTLYYSNDFTLIESNLDSFKEFIKYDKSLSKYYAYLVDKNLYLQGESQLYGTFFIVDYDGKKNPYRIEYEPELDKRRIRLGLKPYGEWKQTIDYKNIGEAMYHREAWYRRGNKKLKPRNIKR